MCIWSSTIIISNSIHSERCILPEVHAANNNMVWLWMDSGSYTKPAEHRMPIVFLINLIKLPMLHGDKKQKTKSKTKDIQISTIKVTLL